MSWSTESELDSAHSSYVASTTPCYVTVHFLLLVCPVLHTCGWVILENSMQSCNCGVTGRSGVGPPYNISNWCFGEGKCSCPSQNCWPAVCVFQSARNQLRGHRKYSGWHPLRAVPPNGPPLVIMVSHIRCYIDRGCSLGVHWCWMISRRRIAHSSKTHLSASGPIIGIW